MRGEVEGEHVDQRSVVEVPRDHQLLGPNWHGDVVGGAGARGERPRHTFGRKLAVRLVRLLERVAGVVSERVTGLQDIAVEVDLVARASPAGQS